MTQKGSDKVITNGFLKKDAGRKWYAVYTFPRSEKQVAERLNEDTIEVFLPLQKTYRTWSDRKKLVEKPLLSSYVFVKVHARHFPRVYTVNGVVKFVSFEGRPAPIPQEQIDNLRLIINSEAEVEVSSEKFVPGDRVEVIRGSLTGLTGELINIGRTSRVIIRIDRLDQNIILKIPKPFLRRLKQADKDKR